MFVQNLWKARTIKQKKTTIILFLAHIGTRIVTQPQTWFLSVPRPFSIHCLPEVKKTYPLHINSTRPVVNCAGVCSRLVPKQKQYRLVLVDTWWYWVSMKWYWLIYDGTGSVEGGSGWYLVVLGQWEAVLVGTWWYWVSRRRHWLVLGGTGSV